MIFYILVLAGALAETAFVFFSEGTPHQAALILLSVTFCLTLLILLLVMKKENQEKLQLIEKSREMDQYFNSALDLLCIADIHGYFRKLNPEWEKILGYSTSELLGRKFLDFVHPEDMDSTLNAVAALSKQEAILNFTNRYRHKDGSYRWIEWRSHPSHNSIYAVARDITERKEMEQTLKKNETLLRGVFEMDPTGVCLTVNKTFILVNKKFCEITGYSESELLGKTTQILYQDEKNYLSIRELLYSHFKNNKSEKIETLWIRKDGKPINISLSINAINPSDYSAGTISVVTDITEQKKIQNEFLQSEEKFRTFFENITSGVAIHDMIYNESGTPVNYRIINVNPAYKEHVQLNPENITGKLATEVYKTSYPPYLEEFSKVAQTRIPCRFETFFEPMKKHFMISVISPRQGQFATIFEDITESKQRESDLRQKNEELARFTYTVSHDLKSPLVTIKAFTSYLKEDIQKKDKGTLENDLGYIQNAADKMGKLLDELLNFSRIGRKDNPKIEISLSSIAHAAADLVAGKIRGNKAQVLITETPVILFGDPQRLLQLYQNLIDNAVKYMGAQENPLIEVGIEKKDDTLLLFVRDNGMGIDPRYHHKLFNLFEKLDKNSEGTGMGLALIKRIVETHRGNIYLKSEGLGKGTTFYFTLENTKFGTIKEDNNDKG